MTDARTPGRGRLAATLDRVPAAEAKATPAEKKKTGTEIVREKWQRNADAKPEDLVRVVDHDAGGQTTWSGTPAQFTALKRALGKEG